MIGPGRIMVRKSDFDSVSEQQALDTRHAMYDLHDFAHMTTATLNSSLYGNTYQSSLSALDYKYTKLITSPGKHL